MMMGNMSETKMKRFRERERDGDYPALHHGVRPFFYKKVLNITNS